jgi:hypothetical protein
MLATHDLALAALILIGFIGYSRRLRRARRDHARAQAALGHWRALYTELADAVKLTGHAREVRDARARSRELAAKAASVILRENQG